MDAKAVELYDAEMCIELSEGHLYGLFKNPLELPDGFYYGDDARNCEITRIEVEHHDGYIQIKIHEVWEGEHKNVRVVDYSGAYSVELKSQRIRVTV